MSKSDYLENKILNHVLKNTAYTSPTTVYLALYIADPLDTGLGTGALEVSADPGYTSGYARQAVTWGTPVDGVVANSAIIDFGPIVCTANITVTHGQLMDSLTGGNPLYNDPVEIARTVTNGKTLRLAVGDLTVTET